MPEKNPKVELGLKYSAMLLNYFEYIFGHLRQKSKSQARIKPEIFVNFRPKPGPSPTRARTRPEKPGSTYNSVRH